jgi:hypothetical protein
MFIPDPGSYFFHPGSRVDKIPDLDPGSRGQKRGHRIPEHSLLRSNSDENTYICRQYPKHFQPNYRCWRERRGETEKGNFRNIIFHSRETPRYLELGLTFYRYPFINLLI